MILMLHIFIALASVMLATYLLFKPSRTGLITSYSFVGATLGSGITLVVLEPAKMMHVCTAGTMYLVVVSLMLVVVRRQLSHMRRSETTL